VNKAYENIERVDIYRLSYDGQEANVIESDISSSNALQRGDRIVVVANETLRKEYNVIVLGEVKRPGTIPITKNSTSLKKVLEDAGGFTEMAGLKKAKLFRGSSNIRFILEKEFGYNLEDFNDYLRGWPNPFLFEYEKSTMLRMSNLTEEDTIFFLADEQIRQMSNEASIDFTNVMDENSEVASLKVNHGDIIIIPPKPTTVYVFGQVAYPGLVKFEEGKDYNYYIDAAGGLGELSRDDDEIMIIKSESKAWLRADKNPNSIEPGDYLYIPKDPVRSLDYHINKVANYLSIVGSIATIIILVVQLGK
jgi:polysaccharide biosynthesis/export protein